jgi:putative permease
MDDVPHQATRPEPYRLTVVVVGVASAVLLLWLMHRIAIAILLLFLALVVAIALSAPVGWFTRHGMSRRLASVVTLVLFFATLGLVAAIVIPPVATQLVDLINRLPDLIVRFNQQLSELLARYPDLQATFPTDDVGGRDLFPAALDLFRGGLGLSLSALGGLALLIIFFSSVLYVVLEPRPILRGYLASLPPAHRRAGLRAYRRAAVAVVGWTKASIVIGAIEFVLVFAFLTAFGIPGALVWATLAFFAEFIPRIGGYVMALPPVLVALTIGPMAALWVALFYLVMNELLGNLLAPRIRGTAMQLHPVLLIFFTLAFALAFGVLGAIVATPAAAFAAAFYGEFYLKRPAVGRPASTDRAFANGEKSVSVSNTSTPSRRLRKPTTR